MRILISACLLGDNCKYNGGNNDSSKLKKILDEHQDYEIIKFCPEILGGLTSPREPIEYVNGKLIDGSGKTYDEVLKCAREKIEKLLSENKIDLAITKAKSPSCGNGQIYDGTFSHTIVNKDGFAVEIIKKYGIKTITENELDSL